MLILHRGRIVDTDTGKVYGLEIATHIDPSGYRQVYLEKGKTQQAHRFIWEAVHGPIPEGMFINHINGVKDDNRLENIELVTHPENIKHAYRIGLASNKGIKHPGAKLNNIRVLAIRALSDLGTPHTVIASRVRTISRSQISAIARRQSWSHLPEHPARIEDL